MNNLKEQVKNVSEKSLAFIKSRKGLVISASVAVILLGGGTVLAISSNKVTKSSDLNLAKVETTSSVDPEKATVDSLKQALSAVVVSADTNLGDLESQVNAISDPVAKAELMGQLDALKTAVEAKKAEGASAQNNNQGQTAENNQAQSNSNPSTDNNTSQVASASDNGGSSSYVAPSTNNNASDESSYQAPRTQETQAPSQAYKPVETTRQTTTTQKIVQKPYRVDPLGNSGKEFATFEEANEWAWKEQPNVKAGYVVIPIFYSDDSVTYSVEWKNR